jgi:hypothetical protein
MHRVYEIFEVLPNGTPQRVRVVGGLESAKIVLQGLAKRTRNECFALDPKTRQVVIQMNVPRQKWRATKHIFQIAYDEEAGVQRADLLKARGYAVVSVIGNDAAKVALSSIQDYDLFIVGHAAPEETRREMVDWLKTQCPTVKILAVNAPNQRVLGADYNVRENDSDRWLRIVTQKLPNSPNDQGPNNASTSCVGP